jgi:hydroxymethylbilane synthase
VRLKIASRKSDLARIQALAVGSALKAAIPNAEIEHFFRESLGDKNLNDPLWKMPERGVFTEDFREDLLKGEVDMVVHSWKDLPVEKREGTEIAISLPRADMRDMVVVKRDQLEKIKKTGSLVVFSSSPRRAYNLAPFLKEALPAKIGEVRFEPVRGNIPTRLRKLFESETVQGLVLAKAAVDRILQAPQEEFATLKDQVRDWLNRCHFMVLPLQVNPAAAAQGALAVEIKSSRQDLGAALKKIACAGSFASAERERQILSGYGGGCHQKIGISVLQREYGEIMNLRGLTDAGQVLAKRELRRRQNLNWPRAEKEKIWAGVPEGLNIFARQELKDLARPSGPVFVARANAWPSYWQPVTGQIIWAAGIETWKKLAARGVWVNGCAEGLGEDEDPRLEAITGEKLVWTKLSHSAGVASQMKVLSTYRLLPQESDAFKARLEGKSHFFWSSASAFLYALQLHPEIANLYHGCGPGKTYQTLKSRVKNVAVFLSQADWMKEVSK